MKKLLLSFLLLASPAWAGPVTVSDAWFRSLPVGPAGGYFTAHNAGKKDLAITGTSSSACGMLMMHQSSDKGGMSGMAMVDMVPLKAGGEARFSAGGYHLMCDDPKMKIGGKVDVTLSLSDGSKVTTAFAVRDAKGK